MCAHVYVYVYVRVCVCVHVCRHEWYQGVSLFLRCMLCVGKCFPRQGPEELWMLNCVRMYIEFIIMNH